MAGAGVAPTFGRTPQGSRPRHSRQGARNVTQSLLDFFLNLMRDGDAKTAFVADPDRALAVARLSNVCSEDVSDAMSYVSEYHPVSFVGYRSCQGSEHASSDRHEAYRSDDYSYADSHDTMTVGSTRTSGTRVICPSASTTTR